MILHLTQGLIHDEDDDYWLFLRNGWPPKDAKSYFQPESLSEIHYCKIPKNCILIALKLLSLDTNLSTLLSDCRWDGEAEICHMVYSLLILPCQLWVKVKQSNDREIVMQLIKLPSFFKEFIFFTFFYWGLVLYSSMRTFSILPKT